MRPRRFSFSHSGENFRRTGHREKSLLGDHLTVEQDQKLAAIAIDQIHLNLGLVAQDLRQTGGTLADGASDRTLPNCDFLHRESPSISTANATVVDSCTRRAKENQFVGP
jgi:hypothetical protein